MTAAYIAKGTEETTKARVYASKNRRVSCPFHFCLSIMLHPFCVFIQCLFIAISCIH